MNTYEYASYTTFIDIGFGPANQWYQHIHNDDGGSLADPKNAAFERFRENGIFEATEQVFVQTSADSSALLSYEGTVEIDGVVHPVFYAAPSSYYVFSKTPEPVGEGILDINSIQVDNPYNFVSCFVTGTAIATPDGPRAVETLEVGDCILTHDGRRAPIRFVGRQSIMAVFARDDRLPILVEAGALGQGMPHRDLILSADHALILDGLLINAGALVNGTTIRVAGRTEVGEQFTYYNIELDAHEVILAEGAPAESFVDYQSRSGFDNFASYVAMYGAERKIPEMNLPRIASHRLVPQALRVSLAGRRTAA